MLFSQAFIYGVIQLVIGSSITNQNVHLPTDTAEVFEQFKSQFTNPNDCCVAPLPGYSPCLAHLAKTIEVININAITETFESRCLRFIAHRIRQLLDHEDWPSKGKIKQIATYVYKVLADNPDDPPGSPPSVTDEALIAMDEILMNTSLEPTPINHQTLAAKIDVYTSILWDMLEEMETDNDRSAAIVDLQEVQDKVDIGWLSSQLQSMRGYLESPRRRRFRLKSSIRVMMNDATAEVHIGYQIDKSLKQELIQLIYTTRRQLECSRLFLAGDTLIDRSVCFQSSTASYATSSRLFTLLPVLSSQRKFVTLDWFCFKKLLMDSGVDVDYDHSLSLPAFSKIKNRFRVFYEHLDFQKVGLEACERNLEQYSGEGQDPPPDVKYPSTNLIRTDGHAIEFIFAKQAPEQPTLPDLTMVDFMDEDLGNLRVYGVDPGVTQLFTAEDEQFRVTQFANAEWYAKSGHIKRRWNQQIRKTDAGVTTVESSLPTHKTARPTNWLAYCQALFNNFETLTSFYGNQWTNERFLSFLGRQKMENEVINIFLSGGKKYPGRAIDNRLPVLAYGNGTFAYTRGGKGASHHGKVYKALKRAEQQGLLVLCLVNEAFTSQICPLCQRRSLKLMEVVDTFSRRMVKLWSAKRCEECLHHWKRDHGAAMNIRDLGLKEQAGHDRPRVFCFGQDGDAMDVDAQAGNAMDMDLWDE